MCCIWWFADIVKILLDNNIQLGDSLLRAVDEQFTPAVRLICEHIKKKNIPVSLIIGHLSRFNEHVASSQITCWIGRYFSCGVGDVQICQGNSNFLFLKIYQEWKSSLGVLQTTTLDHWPVMSVFMGATIGEPLQWWELNTSIGGVMGSHSTRDIKAVLHSYFSCEGKATSPYDARPIAPGVSFTKANCPRSDGQTYIWERTILN